MTDTELLDWIEQNGASLTFASQPDMGGRNWSVRHPAIPSSRAIRDISPRAAILAAMAQMEPKDPVAAIRLQAKAEKWEAGIIPMDCTKMKKPDDETLAAQAFAIARGLPPAKA